MKMKANYNHKWNMLAAMLLGVALMASGTLLNTPVVSAAGTCNVTVDIPDELNAVGAKISIYPWNSYYTDGQSFTKNQGDTVSWKLIIDGFTGKQFDFKVPAADTATLTVGPDAYCTMQVQMTAELAAANAQVNVYPWNTYWSNGQEIIMPVGPTITWKLKVNGQTGLSYTKYIDCTPLVVGNDKYCFTEVQAPTGVVIEIYPWNEKHVNGDKVLWPIGASITWRVKGTSQTYTKPIDCTPLVSPDSTPPVTTASVSPPANANGWNNSDVTVTLSATDSWPGVASTEYNLDSGGWTTYTIPIVVSTEGTHILLYRSTDKAGNVETAKELDIKLDKTAPVTTAAVSPPANANGWNNSDVTVTLSATDTGGSGVASTEYNLDSGGWTTYTIPIVVSTEGTHILLYRSTDKAGNVETAKELDVKLDKTVPVTTPDVSPSPINSWNNTVVTVTLTATDNAGGAGIQEIHYSIDGIPSPIVPGSTTSFALLTDGSHTVSYYAVDNAGNSGTPGTVTVNMDLTPPVVTITAPLDGHYYKSGALPAGAYTVTDANSCTVAEEGYSLVEESHTYKVTATDIAGNVGSASVGYIVDNTAPTVTINAPVNGKTYLSTSVPPVDYTINDIDPNPAITNDGWNNSPGTWTVTVTATDAAGNVGSASSTYYVVPPDSDAPTVLASQDPLAVINGWNNTDVAVTLTATDNAGGSGVKEIHWSDSFDGSSSVFSGATTSFTLSAEGSHNISYYAVDNDGNSGSGNPGTMMVNIDKTAPLITINSPGNGGVYQSDNLPQEDIKVTDNLDPTPAWDVIGDGSDEGVHAMTVTATDAAGNTGTASITYTVDNTPPLVSINAPADGGIYKTGCVPAADYIVTDALDLNPVVVVTGYSTAEGVHTITVTATDAAGNPGTDSATYTVKGKPPACVDKTPPFIIIKSPRAKDYYTWEILKIHFGVQDYQSGVASYSATLDGNPAKNGQAIDLVNIVGSHTFIVTATDKAGNVATKSVKFNVVSGVIKARIHIVPGVINLKSQCDKNAVTVIIDLPRGRGENQIDVSTVKMKINGTLISAQLPGPKERFAFIVKFDRQQVINALNGLNGKVTVIVTGALKDGTQFTGTDTITVINQGNKH